MSEEKIGFLNNVIIPDSFYDVLRKIANNENKTVVQVVADALEGHIKRKEAIKETRPSKPRLLID